MSLLARVHSISPFGPIFGKELRVTSRRKRSYLLRVGYLAFLLMALLLAYTSTGRMYGYGGVAQQAQQQAELGFAFFVAFTLFCVGSMAFIGPVLTSNAIGSEKLAKTLPVLLMTPINAWQVVAGKLFSRVLAALTLIGLSLPVLALVRLLGGVELEQMIAVLILAVTFVIACAAIGLFFSLFINRAAIVILLSYALIGVMYGLVPVLIAIADRGDNGRATMRFIVAINPFAAAGTLTEPRIRGLVGNTWIITASLQLALAAGLVCVTSILLRRQFRHEGARSEGAAPPVYAPAVYAPPVLPPPLPGSTVSTEPLAPTPRLYREGQMARAVVASREVSDNPVLWREIRRPLASRTWQRIVAFLIPSLLIGLVYLIVGQTSGLSDIRSQIAFSIIFCFIWWVLAAVLSATAISQEKESDTWTLLLATPLTGPQIVWGKMAGLLRRMLWPTVFMAVHFFLFVLGGVMPFWSLFYAIWMIVACNIACMATGLYLSLRMKKVTSAVITNLLLGVAVYGLLPLTVLIVSSLVSRRGDRAAEYASLHEPYVYLACAFSGLHDNSYRYNYGENYGSDRPYDLPGLRRLSATDFYLVAFVCSAGHLLFAYIILRQTAANFDVIVGRAGKRRLVGAFAGDEQVLPPTAGGTAPGSDASDRSLTAADDGLVYAGLGRRAVAWVLDLMIVQVPCLLTGLFFGVIAAVSNANDENDFDERPQKLILRYVLYSGLIGLILGWIYFAAMEASRLRATIGKRIMGIFVTDLKGRQISVLQGILRYPARLASALPLGIGLLLPFFNRTRQALHDVMVGTLVLRR